MSLKIHAFYGAQYLGNETTMNDLDKIPDGSYILMASQWYHMVGNALSRMRNADLPSEIKAQLALLGIAP